MPHTPPLVEPTPTARPERRAHRRTLLGAPVLIETEDSSLSARLVNASAGGISIGADLELAVGQDVSVYFELPIGYAVEARARVLRKDEQGVALQFVDLSREAEVALRSFCRLSGLHRIG